MKTGRAAYRRRPPSVGAMSTAIVLMMIVAGCASRSPAPASATSSRAEVRNGDRESGEASWYGEPYHGRRTASGEIYDMFAMTAAHRSLPFGTIVEVRRRVTGDTVVVRITDRGPFVKGRIIDLSYAAALEIGLDIDGVAPVTLKILKRGSGERHPVSRSVQPKGTKSGDCLWVQVGAFGDPTNAARAQHRLQEAGEKTVIVEGSDGLEKVRLGPFDQRRDAEAALDRVRSQFSGARVLECGE